MNNLVKKLCLFALLGVAASCGSYKQNIMFKTPEGFQSADISPELVKVIQDYRIEQNDYLLIDVFSNNGERIIDPNPELSKNGTAQQGETDNLKFLVDSKGDVKLPMINEVHLEGLTLREAETSIEGAYAKFFKDPFVIVNFQNKRAVLLGASGGQVITLTSPNLRLTEVLALGKGLDNNAKAHNIRILRGNEIFLVDLSTIDGYRSGNLFIQPGDVIYIEPIRRPFSEGLRENGTLLSILVSLASFVVIILRF
ncbi:MAG TPA: polysaccharide biosynthesis/export family protein [Cyclobacteriaceae bacterium]